MHHLWTKLRVLRPAYFFILFFLSAIICVFALRANNEHMVKLRNAVYAADKAGTNVQQPLNELRAYVTSHMNTNLSSGPNPIYPPIQLKYTYDRLTQSQSNLVTQTNSQLYSQAQGYCEQLDPTDFSGHNRVPCIEQYVQDHALTQAQIPASLYEFSFLSPSWSPDLAGWSLLATIMFGLMFVISFIADQWFKHYVR